MVDLTFVTFGARMLGTFVLKILVKIIGFGSLAFNAIFYWNCYTVMNCMTELPILLSVVTDHVL